MATNEDKAKKKKLGTQLKQAKRGSESLQTGDGAIYAGIRKPDDFNDQNTQQVFEKGRPLSFQEKGAFRRADDRTIEDVLPPLGIAPAVAGAAPPPTRGVRPMHGADTPSRQTSPVVPTAFGVRKAPPIPELSIGTRQAGAGESVPGEVPTVGTPFPSPRQVPTPTEAQWNAAFPSRGPTVGTAAEAERTNVPVNYGRSFAERVSEGDIFAFGEAGDVHRRLRHRQTKADLQRAKGILAPKEYAAITETISEEQRGLRDLGTEERAATAAASKNIAALGKVGLDAQKLGLERERFGLDVRKQDDLNTKYLRDSKIAEELGVGEFLPIYKNMLTDNPNLTFDDFMVQSGLTKQLTSPQGLAYRRKLIEQQSALADQEESK